MRASLTNQSALLLKDGFRAHPSACLLAPAASSQQAHTQLIGLTRRPHRARTPNILVHAGGKAQAVVSQDTAEAVAQPAPSTEASTSSPISQRPKPARRRQSREPRTETLPVNHPPSSGTPAPPSPPEHNIPDARTAAPFAADAGTKPKRPRRPRRSRTTSADSARSSPLASSDEGGDVAIAATTAVQAAPAARTDAAPTAAPKAARRRRRATPKPDAAAGAASSDEAPTRTSPPAAPENPFAAVTRASESGDDEEEEGLTAALAAAAAIAGAAFVAVDPAAAPAPGEVSAVTGLGAFMTALARDGNEGEDGGQDGGVLPATSAAALAGADEDRLPWAHLGTDGRPADRPLTSTAESPTVLAEPTQEAHSHQSQNERDPGLMVQKEQQQQQQQESVPAGPGDVDVEPGAATAAAGAGAGLPNSSAEPLSKPLEEEELMTAVAAAADSGAVAAAAQDSATVAPLALAPGPSESSPDSEPAPAPAPREPEDLAVGEDDHDHNDDDHNDGEGDDELDDTAIAISVLAAAAAAAANGGGPSGAHAAPPAYHQEQQDQQVNVPPPETFFWRRTDTMEARPVRRPPAVVAFRGGGLRELQALVDGVRGPTIIDLQGRVVTLRAHEEDGGDGQEEERGQGQEAARSGGRNGDGGSGAGGNSNSSGSGGGGGGGSMSLVSLRAAEIPGWSAYVDASSQLARISGRSAPTGAWASTLAGNNPQPPSAASAAPQPHEAGALRTAPGRTLPLASTTSRSSGTGTGSSSSGGQGGSSCLVLHRDDVTLVDGTLQLHRGCRLVVTGARVALRRLEVVDAEAPAWWRQANALPATCLQASALITVSDNVDADGSTASSSSSSSSSSRLWRAAPPVLPQPPHRRHAAAMMWSAVGRSAGRDAAAAGGPSGGAGSAMAPSLDLDECRVLAGGRDRDLVRVDGAGAAVTARYCRLRGGANAVVATLGSVVHLDCCVLEGYATAGLVALGSTLRAVGSRLLGAAGSLIGLQAVASSQVSALGCFFRGHSSNVECMSGASVDMQGCVLARPDTRYGLTLHPSLTATLGSAYAPPGGSPPGGGGVSSNGGGGGCKVRLADCELGHAVQVGAGGELDLERCTFALAAAPPTDASAAAINAAATASAALPPSIVPPSPELAALLAAAAAAAAAAPAAVAGAFAGSVSAHGSLRVVDCRAGAGGEGESVVVEAAQEAAVHLSGSAGVVVRRQGGGRW